MIEGVHRLQGQASPADRLSCRVDSFSVSIYLDKTFEEDWKMASREVIGLAAILQGPGPHDVGLLDSLPRLLDCLGTKGGTF